MLELLITLATVLYFLFTCTVTIKELINLETLEETARVFTQHELDLIKKYTALFGLDNEASDTNVQRILELGLKYENYLGTDTMNHLFEQQRNQHASIKCINRSVRHCINMTIRTAGLVAGPGHIVLSTKSITGGNKDGEPSINFH